MNSNKSGLIHIVYDISGSFVTHGYVAAHVNTLRDLISRVLDTPELNYQEWALSAQLHEVGRTDVCLRELRNVSSYTDVYLLEELTKTGGVIFVTDGKYSESDKQFLDALGVQIIVVENY